MVNGVEIKLKKGNKTYDKVIAEDEAELIGGV